MCLLLLNSHMVNIALFVMDFALGLEPSTSSSFLHSAIRICISGKKLICPFWFPEKRIWDIGTTVGNVFFLAEAGISILKRTRKVIKQGLILTRVNCAFHLSAQNTLTGDLLPRYKLINRSLIYIRGGCIWARIHIDQDLTPSISNSSFSDSEHKFSARIGLGLYYHMTDR